MALQKMPETSASREMSSSRSSKTKNPHMRVFGCLNKLYNILNSTSLEFVMLKRELLNILEDAARDCRVELIDCIIRNKHMNKLTLADIRKLRSDRRFQQKV